MKVEIIESEIKQAIIEYVASQGLTVDGAKARVELRAGRDENGMTASLSISSDFSDPSTEAADAVVVAESAPELNIASADGDDELFN